jgi:hypothetical protein
MKEKGFSNRSELTGKDPVCTVRIIHKCNFRCPACSTFSGPNGQGVLSLTDFCRAVDILARESFRGQLNISGGETTLHHRLDAMLSYASARLGQARICVFTNGQWIGLPGWRNRLRSFLAGPNVLVRFSVDRQHAEGEVRARYREWSNGHVRSSEVERIEKAQLFLQACEELSAQPGINFDFAFKGSLEQGRDYTRSLGEVPLYLIRFRPNPADRPKEFGFFAIDINEENQPEVYLTLGHIPVNESFGGLDTLAAALEINRKALRKDIVYE